MQASIPPQVAWTLRSERRLHEAVSRVDLTPDHRPAAIAVVSQQLAAIFPRASAIIILDLYLGFRSRPNEYVLLVDVRERRSCSTRVVKLAADDRLRLEADAWIEARPPAFEHDRVLMSQDPRYDLLDRHRIIGIVYSDAQSFIGDHTVTLEDAFVGAVRFDFPSAASVAAVLGELFDRLAAVLYGTGGPVTAHEPDPELNPDRARGRQRRRLSSILTAWQRDAAAIDTRQQVGSVLRAEELVRSGGYLDPVDFFRYVLEELEAGVLPGRWVPEMLRGAAHGDLHGRNVLVGIDGNTARWPALFDYENMAADNLVGWDFVKLETELKVRAYRWVFPDRRGEAFIETVQAFECDLCAATERHREDNTWPAVGGDTPQERLHRLLLALRACAGRCLGTLHGRPGAWLEEYYFLLSVYGLHTARYRNQTEQERIAALVSAGVGAARYLWRRQRDMTLIQGRAAGSPQVEAILAGRHPSYHSQLQVAYDWNRGGDRDSLDRSLVLLEQLSKRYAPHLPVWFEYAFCLDKLKRSDDVLNLLREVNERFRSRLDEDTLSLWAKQLKVRGHAELARGLGFPADQAERRIAFLEADRHYSEAVKKYRQAYDLHSNWFPGINLATLSLVRAALAGQIASAEAAAQLRDESERLARELMAPERKWTPRLADDDVWITATRGEAALLLRDCATAEAWYRQARDHPKAVHHHRDSMRQQIQDLILPAFRLLGVELNGALADPATFFLPLSTA